MNSSRRFLFFRNWGNFLRKMNVSDMNKVQVLLLFICIFYGGKIECSNGPTGERKPLPIEPRVTVFPGSAFFNNKSFVPWAESKKRKIEPKGPNFQSIESQASTAFVLQNKVTPFIEPLLEGGCSSSTFNSTEKKSGSLGKVLGKRKKRSKKGSFAEEPVPACEELLAQKFIEVCGGETTLDQEKKKKILNIWRLCGVHRRDGSLKNESAVFMALIHSGHASVVKTVLSGVYSRTKRGWTQLFDTLVKAQGFLPMVLNEQDGLTLANEIIIGSFIPNVKKETAYAVLLDLFFFTNELLGGTLNDDKKEKFLLFKEGLNKLSLQNDLQELPLESLEPLSKNPNHLYSFTSCCKDVLAAFGAFENLLKQTLSEGCFEDVQLMLEEKLTLCKQKGCSLKEKEAIVRCLIHFINWAQMNKNGKEEVGKITSYLNNWREKFSEVNEK